MLKYLGICLFLLGIIGICSAYSAYCGKRCAELSGFIKLISGIKDEIDVYIRPLGVYFSEFHDEALDKLGLDLSSGDAYSAYKECEGQSSLGVRAREVLDGFFVGLGTSDRCGEVKRCETALSRLRKLESVEAELSRKNQLSLGAFSVAIGLSVTILLV